MWPNFGERRVWALIFSYALPAISPGPVLTILALYLGPGAGDDAGGGERARLGSAPHLGHRLFLLGLGRRQVRRHQHAPVGLFLLLTVASLTLGFATWTTSVPIAMALISFSTFIGGGFQMVALKAGSFAFPREQSAMMSGIASGSWSLVNFVLLRDDRRLVGVDERGRWEEIFWLIALLPATGIGIWLVLSRNQAAAPALAPVKACK